MLKYLGILLFIIVTSIAPYTSAKSGIVTLAQNPEEYDFNSANLIEEKLHPETHSVDYINVQTDYIEFPARTLLKPQTIPENHHKPPCCSFTV